MEYATITEQHAWEALLGFAALAWTFIGFAYLCIWHNPGDKDQS